VIVRGGTKPSSVSLRDVSSTGQGAAVYLAIGGQGSASMITNAPGTMYRAASFEEVTQCTG